MNRFEKWDKRARATREDYNIGQPLYEAQRNRDAVAADLVLWNNGHIFDPKKDCP